MKGTVEHGGAPRGWLEFSANLNPCGIPSAVRDAVAGADYGTYAALDTADAERHLAADAGVGADHVLLTAGATEGLRLAITAFVAPGDRAIALGPTYGEFARLVGIRGASFTELRSAPPGFEPPVDALIGELERGGIAAALLCDPNNPTATVLDQIDIRRILAAANVETYVVVDQSFSAFVDERVAVAELVARPNVVLVRSLTKLLATPGLRLGYVIAHPSAIASLRAVRDPWSAGAHALAAALAASWRLDRDTRETAARWRERLARSLAEEGFATVPGEAPFVLARAARAERLARTLGARRIAVRWCASFGLPDHLRVAVRPPAEQDVLLRALREVRAGARA
ncbi:MAG TPA: histidinol-phosphate transaminase [Candidatus Limnocylindria bacterium]|jgi:histidinol-phosphate/aromatic aminotransferase/cobyric acid decarboxylase-like protein|nr:histidinol-phosphate transaminase [Candidatus Limnocylindria bacterium]